LRINYELVARIAQPELAAQARELFTAALPHCQRIDRAAWRKSRSFWSKLKEDWAYFVLARLDPYLARRQWRLMRE
jgi:cardiolipin synthase